MHNDELFGWHDCLSVGVPSIDEQHKHLVALTNRLFLAIMDDAGETVLAGVLSELADYAVYHFDHEERLLRDHGFPEEQFAEHQAEHRALTAKVHELIEEYSRNAACLDLTVYEFLRDWTSEHMSDSDAKYSDFLVARNAK